MAPKSSSQPETSAEQTRRSWLTIIALLVLPSAASCISQMILSPSFGAIPSAVNHETAITITFLLGFLGQRMFPRWNRKTAVALMAVWIFHLPVIEWYLTPYHAQLGPIRGPILLGALSCHTIIIPSAAMLAAEIDTRAARSTRAKIVGSIVAAVIVLISFRFLEAVVTTIMLSVLSLFPQQTPIHLQVLLASSYALLIDNSNRALIYLAIPAIFHTAAVNQHHDITNINRALAAHNWTMLHRMWGQTGYVSVLQNADKAYRVLRADHSLLGGDWLLTPDRIRKDQWVAAEPIYSVFHLLEAVRLMEVQPKVPDANASALVIGAGVGTTPNAFLRHGINTTILELDSAVYLFANLYFGLYQNHTFIHADALDWVQQTASAPATTTKKYDYIIHDVFTGGSEPLSLFTTNFLTDLRSLLNPNGVIAINYAGELGQPLTDRVMSTVLHVFDGHCRAYRDTPTTEATAGTGADAAAIASEDEHFVNLVLFCRNSPGNVAFRRPVPADLLGSLSRPHCLYPWPEQEVLFPDPERLRTDAYAARESRPGLLTDADIGLWYHSQVDSATKHWKIMRGALEPDIVWDLW